MVHVLIQQKVRDFDEWKKEYYNNEIRWKTAGMNLIKMFRSADDNRRVTLLFEVEDIILMHIHMKSSLIIERLMKEGIIIAMKYEVLENIEL